MYFLNLCRQIIIELWAHKLRSILALFGIIWGTITVIMLLALGTGFRIASQQNMMSIVDGTFFITVGKTSKSFHGFPKGQPINIKSSSVMDLPKIVPNVKMVSPWLFNRVNLQFEKRQLNKELFGVSSDFGHLQKVKIISGGRFINKIDVANKNKVAFLGDKLKNQLFGDVSAVGKKMHINNAEFTVIGVTEPSVYDWLKNKIVIPYTVYIDLFGDQNVPVFIVLPNATANPLAVQSSMRGFLANKYHFAKNDKVALRVMDTTKIFQFMKWFFITIELFLGVCGGLTLAVGSLGVTNIMFLIVSERTKEIGIRMAIGAKSLQILWQIILESLIIVILGGIIGFLISYFTIEILYYVNLPDWLGKPVISPTVVIVTISILMIMGVLAGFFPAKRASKMDPVEALGY